MKKITLLSFVLCLSLIGCGEKEEAPTTEPDAPAVPAGETYTMDEVAQHSTEDDCWMVIDGTVYDVSDWVPNHPGGAARITEACGTESSEEYETKGGAGRDHSPQAYGLLDKYEVGVLE